MGLLSRLFKRQQPASGTPKGCWGPLPPDDHWLAVVHDATGELVSTATRGEVAHPLPAGLAVVPCHRPEPWEIWDPGRRRFVERPDAEHIIEAVRRKRAATVAT